MNGKSSQGLRILSSLAILVSWVKALTYFRAIR